MRSVGLSVAFLLMMIPATGCAAKPMAEELEQSLQGEGDAYFLLGPASMGRQNDLPKRLVSASEYQDMRCVAAAGFIRFTRDENIADGKGDDLNDFFAVSRRGIRRYISTELTEEGKRADSSFQETGASRKYLATRPGLDLLKLHFFDVDVTEVIEDRRVTAATDELRLVSAEAELRWTSQGQRVFSACNRAMPSAGRYRVLLRLDPVSRKWEPVAGDAAFDGEFRTQNVDQYLKIK